MTESEGHAIVAAVLAAWSTWRLVKCYLWPREIVSEAIQAMEEKHPGEFADREDFVTDYYRHEGRAWYWISAVITWGVFIYFLRAA